MTARVQTLRSSTKGARPSGRAVGELYTNFPDQQIGVVGPSGNIDLLAVRNFSATADYAVGDLVARGGDIYRAAVAVTAGPWKGSDWTDIVHEADRHHGVTLFDPSKGYLQNELVANNGEIYRANSLVPAAPWNAALWTKISPTPAASMGVAVFSINDDYAKDELVAYQGHVYRAKAAVVHGAWTAAQWENIVGVDYTLPAATATTLGGVKANVGTSGQFVNGIAADGSLTYASTTGGLSYIGNQDCTAAYVAPITTPNVGSFLTNTGTGALHPSWAAVTSNPPAVVAPGDTMVWDGTQYHHNVGQITALPAPTATTRGGVMSNAGTAGQVVSGISATGALTYVDGNGHHHAAADITSGTLDDARLPATMSSKTISGLKETKTAPGISGGTLTLDCNAGNVFVVSFNQNISTIAFTNVPPNGTAYALTLQLQADGTARSVSWPGSVKWPGGKAPTITSTAGKVDTFTLMTHDGGGTWFAFNVGQNS